MIKAQFRTLALLVIAMAMAQHVTATDRFYIQDFTLEVGETTMVNMLLDNETEYTALQADIYLPEGLEIEQEDGEYIFDLTSRKGRDHTITSITRPDGAIRIIVYSVGVKPFSGSSGALVTFNLTANSGFNAPAEIQIKNILFTTTQGNEVAFANESCQVTSNEPELKDLTGEITFTQGGQEVLTLACGGYYTEPASVDTTYEYVDICYTGDENVTFSIYVCDYNLFDPSDWYYYPGLPVWNEEINGYRIYFDETGSAGWPDESESSYLYWFEVVISADGYKEISASRDFLYYVPGFSPKIFVDGEDDVAVVIGVKSWEEDYVCFLLDGHVVYGGDGPGCEHYYAIPKKDVEYDVIAQAGEKFRIMPVYYMGEESVIHIPARDVCLLFEQCSGLENTDLETQDTGENHYVKIVYSGRCRVRKFDITINGHHLTLEPEGEAYCSGGQWCIVDLLPYGDADGGEYIIQAVAVVVSDYDPDYSGFDVGCFGGETTAMVSGEAHFEYHVPTLDPGDVNGDGDVTISDVTALIDILLNGGTSAGNADVNNDGQVTIADVTVLIDYLLGGNSIPEETPNEEIFTVNGVSFKMIEVKEGSFMMGATSEQDSVAYDRERPAHEVELSSYYIGETEVTQELWEAVMGSNPSHFTENPQLPVETVTWNDCQEFIQQLNQITGKSFRLPTEAEWEYAARGGNKSHSYMYAGSDSLVEVAWYANIDGATTKAVATKAANELGLYDMSGNVWEWCQDYYAYYDPSGEKEINPIGPESGTDRVYRGGSWNYNAVGCRVSHRNHATESHKLHNLGFRLAL